MKRCALILVVLAAACGGKSKPAPATPAPEPQADGVVSNTAPASAPATSEEPDRGLDPRIPACSAVIAKYTALSECDKMPKESRDAMKQGIAAMKAGWGDTSKLDDASVRAMNDACTQAIDGINQAAQASGCAI